MSLVKKRPILDEILKAIDKEKVSLALWLGGTVVFHNLNVGGIVSWFDRSNEYVHTGLPYPFQRRIRFPWEKEEKPTLEDKITEWAIPALVSWVMVYHPVALAQFIDAMVPF